MKRVSAEDAWPLTWPAGQERTAINLRRDARFQVTIGRARDGLLYELRALGARYVILSTNVPLRRDGLFYADAKAPEPSDPGVAVYFDFQPMPSDEITQHAMACDRWRTVRDNVHALGKTVEAMRGIERWGSSEIMRRAFSAFKMLPPVATDWRAVFGVSGPLEVVKDIYRRRALVAHPDHGGDPVEMAVLNAAMSAAEREIG